MPSRGLSYPEFGVDITMPKRKVKQGITPVHELPEYLSAMEWEEQKRSAFEQEMERRTTHVPPLVMERIYSLPLETRHTEIVALWDGVPVANDGYSIQRLMEVIRLIPGIDEDVTQWWLYQADDNVEFGDKVHFGFLRTGFYKPTTESEKLIRFVMDTLFFSLLNETPSPTDVALYLNTKAKNQCHDSPKPVYLSEIVNYVHYLRSLISTVLTGDSEHVKMPLSEIIEALNLTKVEYTTDIGPIVDLDQIREVCKAYPDEEVSACAVCNNWFILRAKHASDEFDYCMVCKSMSHLRGISFSCSMDKRLPTEKLSEILEPEPQPNGGHNIYRRIAYLQDTAADYIRMGIEDDMEAPDDKSSFDPCPVASTCKTSCGALQLEGKRMFPLTDDGQYTSCRLHPFMERTLSMDMIEKEELAEKLFNEIKGIKPKSKPKAKAKPKAKPKQEKKRSRKGTKIAA